MFQKAFSVAPGCLLVLVVSIPLVGQQSSNPASEKKADKDIYDSEKRLEGFLSPRESLKALKVPEGFHATLFSAEPNVRQPIAGTTDGKGRLWVCENYTYSESKINFDLSLSDRIIILEDTNQDGQADKQKVFWDRGKRLTSIAIGFDGVFVTCAPHLLFIPDRNHDDVPDGPAEILLDGWNDDAVRHNIVNGLMWGPDGWLYGRHGIMATSFVGRPGDTPSQRVPINCGIWRYHPIHKKVEVVAHGTTNPWGMDFNNEGDLFMINTVIGHLWHVVPGARYERMYGSHFNPYTYRTIQQTADHFHWNKTGGEAWHDTKKTGVTEATDRFGGGHAHCGLLFYGDEHWPKEYRNTLLTCNLHGLRINSDRLEPHGNGYVGKHNPDFAKSTDQWFRGIELVRSHDQGFYLLDWQDTGECHENDGVHRTSGRIYKIRYGYNKDKVSPVDLAKVTDKRLASLAVSEDRWYLQQCLVEMRTRLARSNGDAKQLKGFLPPQRGLPKNAMVRQTLAADWGADKVYTEDFLSGTNVVNWSRPYLSEQDRWIREWLTVSANENALRKKTWGNVEFLVGIAKNSSPGTRLALASRLDQMKPEIRFEVAQTLIAKEEDRDDNMQPLLIWYSIEPLVCKFPANAVKLIGASRMPLVSELIARRLTEEIENKEIADHLVKVIADPGNSDRRLVLKGMADALKGRQKLSPPMGWNKVVTTLNLEKTNSDLIQQIQVIFGDGQTLENVRKTADDRSADPRTRGQAFLTLAENKFQNLKPLLDRHLGDRDVRQYVIEAYAHCADPDVATKIINQFEQLKPAGKKAAINTLTKRESWAQQLLHAVDTDRISRSHISAWHARQIENMGNESLSKQLNRVWGTIRKSSAEKQVELERVKSLLATTAAHTGSNKASLTKGQMLFEKSCGNCHVLFGTGGKIGPDLTGSNRKDLGYLLENILDPNSSVAESFRTSIIALEDGRTITGVILEESTTTLRVQTAEKIVILDRESVEKVKTTQQSLMPDGLLKDLSNDDIRNLFHFLQSN